MIARFCSIAAISLFFCIRGNIAQAPQGPAGPPANATAAALQTETDAYTRYELLRPESASFRIVYEVTATTEGAKFYYNPIRDGSQASDEAVYDAMTGAALKFAVVGGTTAKQDPLMAKANPATRYIRVTLARPVPRDGQGRLRIVKTYRDAKSYFREGDAIVFHRALGIKRNSVVLPVGYELVGCNVPSQVLSEPDGRIAVSFMNASAGDASLELKAKRGALAGQAAAPRGPSEARSWEPLGAGPTERVRLSERAHQDRDIVYFLAQPETHSFSLYHDYTESSEGEDKYLNVVREGSTVSNPSARVLDTGEALETKIMKGSELSAAGIKTDEPVSAESEVVVIPFPAVRKGESIRLRISETYTALQSYRLEAGELVFDRSFGRPRNAVVLPSGWYLTASSIPATVTQFPDGRVRLDFWNGRPDVIAVLIKARRRPS